MNLRAELALVLAARESAPTGLYFRPSDALRLEGCLASVLREGRSVALASTHEAALGHCAELLIDRLRRSAACPVEVYFPASTQAMVARFDELLASMTLQEALAERHGAGPQRIWLVHDASALAEPELKLLSRLVSNFPGAGVAVVLLLGPGLRSRQALEMLGRRFVRWDIEPPTPEQALAMRELARAQGCEPLVAELLRHVQPAPLAAAPSAALTGAAVPAPKAPRPLNFWQRLWPLRWRCSPAAARQDANGASSHRVASSSRDTSGPGGAPSPSGAYSPAQDVAFRPAGQGAGRRATAPHRAARGRRLAWVGGAAMVVAGAAALALHPPRQAIDWLGEPVRAFFSSDPLSPRPEAAPRLVSEPQRT